MPGLLLPLSGIGNSLRAEPETLAASTTSVYVVPLFLPKQNQTLWLYSQVQFMLFGENWGEEFASLLGGSRFVP